MTAGSSGQSAITSRQERTGAYLEPDAIAGRTLPLVSVGVPTYNRAEFLRRTIDSLLLQTYPSLDILVADDASTDHTSQVVEEAIARDARVRYHRHSTNQGPIKNCEFVIHQAQQPYFFLMGDDDLAAPLFVERLVAELERDPGVHLAFCDVDVIDDEYRVVGRVTFEGLRPQTPWRDAQMELWNFPYSNTASLVHGVGRTAAFKRLTQPFSNTQRDIISGHEAPFLAQIASRGRIVTVPEVLFSRMVHRQTRAALTHTSSSALTPYDLGLLYGTILLRLAWYAVRADAPWSRRIRLLMKTIDSGARKVVTIASRTILPRNGQSKRR